MLEENRLVLDGSGGGGKGGKGKSSGVSAPKESNVSLQSQAYVTALFLLSEGAIQGSADVDLAKSIFINETPIKNADNSFNFKNIWAAIRVGNPSQTVIPLTGGIISSITRVDTKVTQLSGAVTRTINNANATGYSITVYTPTLRLITDKEIKGTSVQYKVEISTNGGGFVLDFQDEINGYTPTGYERTIERPLPAGSSWQIRLTRLTADSASTSLNNDLYWQTLSTLTETKLTYPYSALLAVKISADQFSAIPKFAVELKGRTILIPHNYNPTTRVYSGAFNGSLVPGYSDNPAWCFYDMVTNKRYGLGKYVADTAMDVYSLYTIGQYCDQLVPNGKGGYEPRFTCNVYIKDAEEAAQVISDLASVFRGMTYYDNGTVKAVQDSPRTPVKVFNEANVLQTVDEQGRITEPTFRYSGTAQRAIHTAAIVYWNDPKDFYRLVPEYIDNPTQIVRHGFNPTEVRAFGCTSQGQARRVGEWLLASEQYRTQTITFRVGAEGLLLRPNEVIKVYDPLRMTARRGGRIVSATSTSITIDAPFDVVMPRVWTLHFMSPGGVMLIRQINNTAGTTSTLTWAVGQALAAQDIPMPNQAWCIESDVVSSTLWQIMSVKPLGGETYEVIGIEYNDGLYNYVDRNQPIPDRVTTGYEDPRKPPQAPGSLTVAQSLYESSGSVATRVKLEVTWALSGSPGTKFYQLQWRLAGDPVWSNFIRTDQNGYTIYDAVYGTWEFRVRAETPLGNVSEWAYGLYNNTGLTDPPSTPTGLTINVLDTNTAIVRWDISPDLDVRVGGRYKLKYTYKIYGAGWRDGDIIAEVSGSTNSITVPLRSGSYMLKAVDSSGFESLGEAAVVLDNIPEIVNMNAVHLVNEEAGAYPGTHQNTIYTGSDLRLTTTGYFDVQTGLFESAAGNFDEKSANYTVTSPGTYTFLNPVDLQHVFTCRITVNIDTEIIDESNLFDSKFGFFDSAIGFFDGVIPQGATATVLVSTSQDNVTFTPFAPITTADYRARVFKFKVELESESSNINIAVHSLNVVIDMPDRVESNILTVPAGLYTVNFANRFNNIPAVGVTIQNGVTGDYPTITNITQTGFRVQIKNAANADVSRLISWIAKGYGLG